MFRPFTASLGRTAQRAKPLPASYPRNSVMVLGPMLTGREPSTLPARLYSSPSPSSSSSSPSPSDQRPNPGDPEIPSFSLSALGLSKNMKMLVLGLIGIFGTIETWFWCKAVWQWWEGRQQGGKGEQPAED